MNHGQSVILLIQLLNAMREASLKLEEAYNKGDYEGLILIKKELVEMQKRVEEMI